MLENKRKEKKMASIYDKDYNFVGKADEKNIYNIKGDKAGFIFNDKIFNIYGSKVGSFSDGKIYNEKGQQVGKVESNYIYDMEDNLVGEHNDKNPIVGAAGFLILI